jgi:hypothetical protein
MAKCTPSPCRTAVAGLLLCVVCPVSRSQAETGTVEQHYVRAKDPKWYAQRLVPLRQELADIDQQIRAVRQARKGDARATTGAVNLDKANEAVDTQADLSLLQERRTQLVQRVSEIEDEARRNDVAPGTVRAAEGSVAEGGTSSNANEDARIDTPEIAETKEALHKEQEHLERAKNEANFLERKLTLDTHTVYSTAEYTAQKSGKAKLKAEKNQIADKQDEIQQTEQKITDLEDRLQDLRLHSTNKSSVAEPPAPKIEEKDEVYWRKQFGDVHYKIRMAQTELDILQRELNESLLIYDPNPQKAMRENVTRKNINAHRQAIEDKKKELADLRKQLSDLEDELRHAGGDPGWSRE